MPKHRLRYLINSEYSRTAQYHIKRGDIEKYTADDTYIYRELTHEEYIEAIRTGENEPFIMKEIGLQAEYDYTYKP